MMSLWWPMSVDMMQLRTHSSTTSFDCGDSDDAAGVVSGWGESEDEAEEDE